MRTEQEEVAVVRDDQGGHHGHCRPWYDVQVCCRHGGKPLRGLTGRPQCTPAPGVGKSLSGLQPSSLAHLSTAPRQAVWETQEPSLRRFPRNRGRLPVTVLLP